MLKTNIPTKIPQPFAYNAGASYKNTIPTASQISIENGRASLNDGFPPNTFLPLTAGGVPPFGADVNGILNEITSITQWQQAGGFFVYDSTFSTTIGGYPKGAILQSADSKGLWVSSSDSNTTNPDTGGSGWVSLVFEGTQAITVTTANVAVSQLQAGYPVLIISGALTSDRSLIMPAIVGEWIIQNNTTGAFALTIKTASGTGVTATQSQSTFLYGDGTNILFADSSKVASFNSRSGTVTLSATDVTDALGYSPPTPVGVGASGTWGINTTGSWAGIPSGTVTNFFQAAAPTGWTQNTSYANHMMRVVSGAGGGSGGSTSPILNNTVPSHTHTFTSGTESSNHVHTDGGHNHSMTFNRTSKSGNATAYMVTDPNIGENINGAATYGTSTGFANIGINTTNHTHSGTTNSGSSQTNWTPYYIDNILCAKN